MKLTVLPIIHEEKTGSRVGWSAFFYMIDQDRCIQNPTVLLGKTFKITGATLGVNGEMTSMLMEEVGTDFKD